MKEVIDLTLEEIGQALEQSSNVLFKEQQFTCGCIYFYFFRPKNKWDLAEFAGKFDCGCNGKVKVVT